MADTEHPALPAETAATTEQPVPAAAEHSADGSVLGFNGQMVLLTWVAFTIAAVILGKVLWKPILKFVEDRESEIKTSLDDAEAARKSAREADGKAAEVVASAAAKARCEAEEIVAGAHRHITAMEAEAQNAIAAKKQLADTRLAEEREKVLAGLNEQAGSEIAAALDRLLPGMLTDAQRKAYQDRIAAEVTLR